MARFRDVALIALGAYGLSKILSEQPEPYPYGEPPAGYGPYGPVPPGMLPYGPYPPAMPPASGVTTVQFSDDEIRKVGMVVMVLASDIYPSIRREELAYMLKQLLESALRTIQSLQLGEPLSLLLVWGILLDSAIHPQMQGASLGPVVQALSSPVPERVRLGRAVDAGLSIYQRGMVPHPFKVRLLQVVDELLQTDPPRS
jgi:hypothetical protein